MVAARRTAAISIALLILALACNSIVGFDDLTKSQTSSGSSSSGVTDDDTTDDDDKPDDDDDITTLPDGGKAPPRCDKNKPFEAPAIIVAGTDSTKETRSALMTPDELELFYLRGSGAPFELRHAKRASRTDKDGNPERWGEPVTEALSPTATLITALVIDGTKLYYWNVDVSSPTLATSVYTATRPPGGAFSTGTKVIGTNRPLNVNQTDSLGFWPEIKTVDGSLDNVIHQGSVQGASIANPKEVPALHSTPALDDNPVISPNELVIYFSSQRKIAGALGADDIYRAVRPAKGQTFGAPQNVTELNSETLDEPTWVSEDDCVIMFTRSKHILIAQRGR